MSKEICEIYKPTNILGKRPTRMIPYPSLEFTVPQKYKEITPIGPILVQMDLQAIYKDVRKGSLQSVNENRLHAIPANKRLLKVKNCIRNYAISADTVCSSILQVTSIEQKSTSSYPFLK